MCGIAGIVDYGYSISDLKRMLEIQNHRGPDSNQFVEFPGFAALGHNRLSILDLSETANQPMADVTGRYTLVFNGEIYNYLELKRELSDYPFRTGGDSEVILAAYSKWGSNCLSKFIGMFSFAIWDNQSKLLFAARDRFGVKPFYYSIRNSAFIFASEIKTLWASGTMKAPNQISWSNFLVYGSYGLPDETFWEQVSQLPAGHCLSWSNDKVQISRWYIFEGTSIPSLPQAEIQDYLEDLLLESIRFRFRSDVPVGFNLSGGLDSSLLLALVDASNKSHMDINAYTFTTGDSAYDEIPWVRLLLEGKHHPLIECRLNPGDVPDLTERVAWFQDEPFSGLPVLAYSNIFKAASSAGIKVLLDGQGIDETWAGYDYYLKSTDGIIQGSNTNPFRPECFNSDFVALSTKPEYPTIFDNRLQNLQYRDLFYTKIPRALRFNDRISMMYSTELREPFLDHRLVEFGFWQPDGIKISGNIQKKIIRSIAAKFLGDNLVSAPKRPLQTPQREWLAGSLRDWVEDCIAKVEKIDFVDRKILRKNWELYQRGDSENSFFVWQWISLANL